MRKAFGHSIAEYMLIFALVAIIAIPAIQILGQAIAGGLAQQGTETASGAERLMSLISPGGAGGGSGTSYDGSGQTMMNLWKTNPEDGGAARIWRDESGGYRMSRATDATSVNGGNEIVKAMADTIGQFSQFLQENGAEDLGLNPELLLNIERLSKQGHKLGGAMESFNKASDAQKNQSAQFREEKDCFLFFCDKENKDIQGESQVRMDVWNNYQVFGSTYDEVQQMVAAVPDDHPLKADLNALLQQHSNVITNVAYSNYVEEYGLGTKYRVEEGWVEKSRTVEVEQNVCKYVFFGCEKKKVKKTQYYEEYEKQLIRASSYGDALAPLKTTGGAIEHDVTLAYSPPETHYRSDRIKSAEQDARRKRMEARQAEQALERAKEERRQLEAMADAGDGSAAEALREAERAERDAARQLTQAEREVDRAERTVEREITQAERDAQRAAEQAARDAGTSTGELQKAL